MWPFTSRSSHLPQEEQEHLRKRLRPEHRAYRACVKANGGNAASCRQLEVRIPEDGHLCDGARRDSQLVPRCVLRLTLHWNMQVRLLERYSELVCPQAAAQYQECYTASLARGDIVLDRCSKQVCPCSD